MQRGLSGCTPSRGCVCFSLQRPFTFLICFGFTPHSRLALLHILACVAGPVIHTCSVVRESNAIGVDFSSASLGGWMVPVMAVLVGSAALVALFCNGQNKQTRDRCLQISASAFGACNGSILVSLLVLFMCHVLVGHCDLLYRRLCGQSVSRASVKRFSHGCCARLEAGWCLPLPVTATSLPAWPFCLEHR